MREPWYGTEGVCEVCSNSFVRKRSEDQRFCSKKCFAQTRRVPERPCKHCGNPVAGRDSRIFCNRACANAFRKGEIEAATAKGSKACSRCLVVKTFDQFSPHKGGIGKVRNFCKPCASEATMAYHQTEPGKKAHRKSSSTFARTVEGASQKKERARRDNRKRPEVYLLRRALQRANQKGIPFSLTLADIVIPERCPVFGTPFDVSTSAFRQGGFGGGDTAPSLDKIIPALGYVPGNVAVISWRANRLKSASSLTELEAIVAWLRSVLPERHGD